MGGADGYRLGERAEEWTCGTAQETTLPAWHTPSLNVKTFPLVCGRALGTEEVR